MSSKKSFLAALCLLAMPGVSPAEPVGPKPVPVSATAAKRDFYAAKAQEGYAEVAALKIPPDEEPGERGQRAFSTGLRGLSR